MTQVPENNFPYTVKGFEQLVSSRRFLALPSMHRYNAIYHYLLNSPGIQHSLSMYKEPDVQSAIMGEVQRYAREMFAKYGNNITENNHAYDQ